MTLTVLFDLDDTLLLSNINTFLPAYIKLLSRQLADWPPELVIKHLLAATQKMVEKTTPAKTLEATFDEHFYPALGTTRQALQPTIDHFYRDVYPTLRQLTAPQSAAQNLIGQLIERGHSVAVATNPLFPATAIEQRLEWAGLPVGQTLFKCVTNFSDFHFAKPHPAFYAEILAQLGWPEQPAVMIGDSLQDDVLPASKLGLPVFWINQNEPLPEDLHPLSRSGTLEGVPAWLSEVETANLELQFSSPPSILAVLKSTPAALDRFVRPLTKKQWHTRPKKGEWCLTEIICHLRDVDQEINLPRVNQILSETNPFLPGVLSDNWAVERKYCKQDGCQALADFCATRTALVQRLASLTPEDWNKPARHAIFGPTRLQELTSFMAAHDRNHIQQAHQLLAQ